MLSAAWYCKTIKPALYLCLPLENKYFKKEGITFFVELMRIFVREKKIKFLAEQPSSA